MQTIWFIFCTLLAVGLPSLSHGVSGAAVFGSFTNEAGALSLSRDVAAELNIRTRVAEVEINGKRFFRVLSVAEPEARVREIIRVAENRGYPKPWYLPEALRSSNVVDAPVLIAAESRAVALSDNSALTRKTAPADSAYPSPPTQLTIGGQSGDIPRLDAAQISIDGYIDEGVWAQIEPFDRLTVLDPDTLEPGRHETQTRIFYDDNGLYVAAIMKQPAATLVERLSARDEDINRDGFSLMLDTSGQGLYGYIFGINLGGTKQDGKLAPESVMSYEWDGAWRGKTRTLPDGWSAEIFIPWSILTMPESDTQRSLAIFVARKVAYLDEFWGWPQLPFSGARFISGFQPYRVQKLQLGQQWEAYPYASATVDNMREQNDARVGVDLSWRPSSNLQLTATLNPDFGAVESDDVVVNLTAYETYFPEKRLFFLEGTEVFETTPRSRSEWSNPRGSGGRSAILPYTMEPTTLLNTRRIGGAARNVDIPDGVSVAGVELSKPTELIGAVKAVGQSGNLRYGFLSAFENESDFIGQNDATGDAVTLKTDGRDFGVARLLYEASSDAGRNSIGYLGTVANSVHHDAVVHGIDTHWMSPSGKWSIDNQVMASEKADTQGYGLFIDVAYTPQQGMSHSLGIDALDDKLDISDLGYLRTNDSYGASYSFMTMQSQGLPSWLRNRSLGLFLRANQNGDGYLNRGYAGVFAGLLFADNSEFRMEMNYLPAYYDDKNSRGNGLFQYEGGHMVLFSYGTSTAKKFATSIQFGSRGGMDTDISYIADFGFTYRPVDRFSLDFDLGFVQSENWYLHQGDTLFTSFDALQVRPGLSMDYFISANQQLRFSLQWIGIVAEETEFWRVPTTPGRLIRRTKNNPSNVDDFAVSQMTSQLRYRWEIAPLSDLFIVYTRGSNLPNQYNDDFGSLFEEAFNQPIIDTFTVKLRYRFSS